MELGFETIGNATVIAYDREPIIATDPWIQGSAYFGSWILSHAVPTEQREAIRAARYLWFSHGHPDHLNPDSLELYKGQKLLVPDHYGGRIARDLAAQGHDVDVCPDRKWLPLSDRVRVMCVSDYNQDAVLLMDVGGRLVVNLNDAHDRGWDRFVRGIVAGYEHSYLVCLTGYGDAYLINYFDEGGQFIPPVAARRDPVGPQIMQLTQRYGARAFIPFSSMHKYQRSDSVRMNAYATPIDAYGEGFEPTHSELLPPFLRVDCLTGDLEPLDPPENPDDEVPCEKFGDVWSDRLEADEFEKVAAYFRAFEHLDHYLDFIRFRVGGHEHVIEFKRRGFDRGITFETPRGSLVQAVEWEIFDDLLIGNFMRATLHGRWPATQIYPDFEPYVTKYGDNGGARTRDELREYWRHYRQRSPVEFLMHRLETRSRDVFRRVVNEDSALYALAKRGYHLTRGG